LFVQVDGIQFCNGSGPEYLLSVSVFPTCSRLIGIFDNMFFYLLSYLGAIPTPLKEKPVEVIAYPEQQLPGVPHELGAPQQLPGLTSEDLGEELLDILCVDNSLVKSSLPQCLHRSVSCFPRIRNSFS
jgi:hypothetical protein